MTVSTSCAQKSDFWKLKGFYTLPPFRRVQPTRCNVSQFIYFCKTLYMFQTVFSSIIRSSKLHIQRQVFVRPQFRAPDDGRKNRLKHVERLTEINKL